MYGIASVTNPDHSPRAHGERRAHELKRAREEAAALANVSLSRFERGLLAFDGLIRRFAHRRRRPQGRPTLFQCI